ncbi:hypothetical protein J132_03684 [Termitomyces sp. J132]|nr:hypothetical protein J132_03684 [Termitomyces sp. J132]
MIPNYFSKQLYMECIEEWHRLNPGQIITARLSSNANPDPEQAAMQQSLIHEVMQQDIAMSRALSKEEWIEALEHELFALRRNVNDAPKVTPTTSDTPATLSPPDATPAPVAKPADKGKAPERTIAKEQPPVAKEPVAQPPIHPFSGIPSCYAPPANRNFAAPDRTNDSAYQTMPPIYDIKQSKAVFEWAPFTSVDPVEAYINLLLHGEEPVMLTVAKDSQSLRTIMMLIDNKEEVECIHDSSSQIILMSAEIASDIGLSYDPNIVLNMQSTNGTMDQSLGLACNVPCTIGDIMIYLQIHILQFPAYDILLGCPFDILTQSTVNTISNIETTITIMDPNTGQQRTIPTFPHGKSKRNNRQNVCFETEAFFELLNRILQQMKYCGGTFSGHKLVLCAPTFKILGHVFDGDQSKWSTSTYSVFWSEHVTVRKRMGCSPYFMTTGTHPLLPADIVEATYLQLLPNLLLLTTDLIACQAINLQRRQEDLNCLHSQVLSAHCLAAIRFETEHAATIRNYNFKAGDLILMWNTRIEVTHNKKMKPHYLGLLVVISRNHGGTYIVCELDGSVLHRPIAAFCLIPYLAREHVTMPSDTFDIDTSHLRELEQTKLVDDDDTGEIASEEENYLSLSLSNFS